MDKYKPIVLTGNKSGKISYQRRNLATQTVPELAFDPVLARNELKGMTKYDQKTMPLLCYNIARGGATRKEIAEALVITLSTLDDWVKKYAELRDAIQMGVDDYDSEVVEVSLRKRAAGYKYRKTTTKQTFIYQKVSDDAGGTVRVKVPAEEVTVEETEMAPDTVACIFWLKNRQPERWKDVKRVVTEGKHLHAHVIGSKVKDLMGIEKTMSAEELELLVKMIGMDEKAEYDITDYQQKEITNDASGNGEGAEKTNNTDTE